MDITEQIENHINGQPGAKRNEMMELHQLILDTLPGCRLWFDDDKNADNKTVANPTIGYGFQVINMPTAKQGIFSKLG